MTETFIPGSSTLDRVEYDPEEKLMVVAFKTGNTYEYRGVPNEVYLALQHARSPGSYFYSNIRTRYPYTEV